MPFSAEVYRIMIASPSDVIEEKKITREVIADWNNLHSTSRKIVLMAIDWEANSFPSLGNERPQNIINEQVLKYADILIGIFWTRIGSPTGLASSGTVEEIQRHVDCGKLAMLYFSDKPIPPASIDSNQYKELMKLKAEFQNRGIINHFKTTDDFKNNFSKQLTLLLNSDEFEQSFNRQSLTFKNNDIIENLPDTAIKMLIECSKDKMGQILKISFIGGIVYQTNGVKLNIDYTPRTLAKWDFGLETLLKLGLVQAVGAEGQIFKITEKGYVKVESLLKE
jgi:hypothetical protein